jgi:hypothetical protein
MFGERICYFPVGGTDPTWVVVPYDGGLFAVLSRPGGSFLDVDGNPISEKPLKVVEQSSEEEGMANTDNTIQLTELEVTLDIRGKTGYKVSAAIQPHHGPGGDGRGNVAFGIDGESGYILIQDVPKDIEEVATFFEELDLPRPGQNDLGELVAMLQQMVRWHSRAQDRLPRRAPWIDPPAVVADDVLVPVMLTREQFGKLRKAFGFPENG